MNWTTDWPTERGYYWFYGWCFQFRHFPPDVHFVKVRHDSAGLPMYATDGHFMFQEEGAKGLWQPVDMPNMPDVFAQNEGNQ